MEEDKAVKISISLSSGILKVIDEHEDNRSAYLQRVATADLEATGRLPNSPRELIRTLAIATAAIAGDEAVITALTVLKADASYKKYATSDKAATTAA